jgi:hypothetical protein
VAVMSRNRAAFDSVVKILRKAGAAHAVRVSKDMTDATSIAAGVAAVSDLWGN